MADTPTISEALQRSAELAGVSDSPQLDGQILLAEVVGQSRTWLIAHDDALLSVAQSKRFDALLERRADGEPVAYLLGYTDTSNFRRAFRRWTGEAPSSLRRQD